MKHIFLLAPLLPLLPLTALAQERIDATVATVGTVANEGPLPQGGASWFSDAPWDDFALAGRRSESATISRVPIANAPAGLDARQALRAQVTAQTPDDSIVLASKSVHAAKAGATFFIRLWGRVVGGGNEKGEGSVGVNIVEADGEGVKAEGAFFGGQATFGREWRRFDFPLPLRLGWKQSRFIIKLGGAPRTMELAGLQVIDYADKVQPHALPFKRATYPGREAGAAWRVAAVERIEQHRKGQLQVLVKRGGKALPNIPVKIEMKRHAFRWGTAVNRTLLAKNATGDKYRAAVEKYFNSAVIENDFKWSGWANPNNRQAGLDCLAWLRARNMPVRAHCAIWPGWRNTPAFVKTGYEAAKAQGGEEAGRKYLRETIEAHFVEEVGALKGLVEDWDVVNETVGNHDFMDILGQDELATWYKRVHEIDAGAKLYHNENSLESGSKVEPFSRDVKLLQKLGAPLYGLGLQGHVGAIDPERVWSNINKLTGLGAGPDGLGMPWKITEFDIKTPDEALQADYTRDFLTLAFSHPTCEGFLMWGFWDGAHWQTDAPLFYRDWTLKPSGQAYEDLVLKAWWTRANGVSDAGGSYVTRGFLGDYEVTASVGNQTKVVPLSLGKAGQSVTIEF